jgi:hypothetical protein
MGPLALLALPVLPPVTRSFIGLGMIDYDDWPDELPDALDLPGVLQFGGLEAAAALAAPRVLYLSNPAETFRDEWPRSAYRAAGAPERLRINHDAPTPQELAAWITGME